MTFKLNLDDVEPWSGSGVILAPGTHPVVVRNEEIDETGDHPVVMVQMEAIGGEEKGGEIRDWIHVTKNTLGRIAQIYKAFGVDHPSGEFTWIPLLGKQAKVVVRNEPKRDEPSKTRTVVKGYAELSGVDLVAAAFDATPIENGDPGPEPDIPF